MGGRGASSASASGDYVMLDRDGNPKLDADGNPMVGHYGGEYRSIATFNTSRGEVKVIKQRNGDNNKKPLETRTPNRIYATVDSDGEINNIYFYDENGKSREEWNIRGHYHYDMEKHKHVGYYHAEEGTFELSEPELEYAEEVRRKWRTFRT